MNPYQNPYCNSTENVSAKLVQNIGLGGFEIANMLSGQQA